MADRDYFIFRKVKVNIMMNNVGRAIVNEINKATKDSKYGTYLPVYEIKNCIKKYYSDVDACFNSMVNKKLVFLSKSGKAATLSKGLIEGFIPYKSNDYDECCKFTEWKAEEAWNAWKLAEGDVNKVTQWILFYGFYGFMVSESHKSTFQYISPDNVRAYVNGKYGYTRINDNDDNDMFCVTHYRNNTEYWKSVIKSRAMEQQKEAEQQKQKENERNCNAKEYKIHKPYCVQVEVLTTFIEIDGGEILNCEEGETETYIRYFDTLKEAKEFKDLFDGKRLESEDPSGEWELDYEQYDYKVLYCGKTTDEIKGSTKLFPNE